MAKKKRRPVPQDKDIVVTKIGDMVVLQQQPGAGRRIDVDLPSKPRKQGLWGSITLTEPEQNDEA